MSDQDFPDVHIGFDARGCALSWMSILTVRAGGIMRRVISVACGILMAASLGGCAMEESSDEPGVDGINTIQGEALSPEVRATIEANDDFQAVRRQLESHGDLVDLEKSVVYRKDGNLGVVCPIERVASGVGEYEGLVYQDSAEGESMVSLELSHQSTGKSVGDSEPQSYTCGGWSGWYTISTYCTWHIMCLGDATMLVRERWRTCCATSCWTETEHTTVRNRCGC